MVVIFGGRGGALTIVRVGSEMGVPDCEGGWDELILGGNRESVGGTRGADGCVNNEDAFESNVAL